MKYVQWWYPFAAVAVLVVAGCEASRSTGPGSAEAEEVSFQLCGDCGQVKGSELCCAEGAENCEKCGLAKGSPGCCTIEKGTDVVLCVACGQIKGSDACCAEGAEKCDKCGLCKGSPGCCNIPKKA